MEEQNKKRKEKEIGERQQNHHACSKLLKRRTCLPLEQESSARSTLLVLSHVLCGINRAVTQASKSLPGQRSVLRLSELQELPDHGVLNGDSFAHERDDVDLWQVSQERCIHSPRSCLRSIGTAAQHQCNVGPLAVPDDGDGFVRCALAAGVQVVQHGRRVMDQRVKRRALVVVGSLVVAKCSDAMLTQVVGNVAQHRDGRDGVQARVHPDAAGAPDEQGAGKGVWCVVGAPGWVLKQRFESDVSGDLDAGSVGTSAGVGAEVACGCQWYEQSSEEVHHWGVHWGGLGGQCESWNPFKSGFRCVVSFY